MREKVLNAASHLLEAAPADLVADDGRSTVAGTDRSVTFRELARAVYSDMARLPPDAREELAATKTYDPVFGTTTSATHIGGASRSIPRPTRCKLERFVVAEDCGRDDQPADRRRAGAWRRRAGHRRGALEEVVYDDDGQLHTASLVDYLVPSACEIPPIEVAHLEGESPTTLGGFRGMGEGGTIGAPAAVANAIADALVAARIEINELPVTPERLFRLIEAARTELRRIEHDGSGTERQGRAGDRRGARRRARDRR